jgi:hypothetical protein
MRPPRKDPAVDVARDRGPGKDPKHTVLARLARIVARDADRLPLGQRLCTAVVDLLGVEGAVLTFGYEEPARLTVWASDETANWLDGIQEVLGEGPGWEAFQTGQIVTTSPGGSDRWAQFSRAAEAEVGHLILHAVPMRPGGEPMGVMLLYQSPDRPGIDSETATFLANAVGAALLRTPTSAVEDLDGPWRARSSVHQAVGMVMAQLGISAEDALVLMRAHAYAHETSLAEIAGQIVGRRLDFKFTDIDPEDT